VITSSRAKTTSSASRMLPSNWRIQLSRSRTKVSNSLMSELENRKSRQPDSNLRLRGSNLRLREPDRARGPFLTLPLGANFDPRGKVVPRGCNYLFAPPFFWRVDSAHPWGWMKGWTFSLGDKFHPWEPSLEERFTSGGPGVKLRMSLSILG
jgi:hypothetical protein